MKRKEFNNSVSAEIATAQLRGIYDRLEDEATPHAIRIRKGGPHKKQITIYCDDKDVAYFNTIIWVK